jgi:hypothetical protein
MATAVAAVIGRNPLAIHWAALTARAAWDVLAPGRVSAALASTGYQAGQVGNTASRTATAVRYGAGASAQAGRIAARFGAAATASASVAAGHVQVLLGASATVPGIPPSDQSKAPASVIPTPGPQGGAVTARNGIPCVN